MFVAESLEHLVVADEVAGFIGLEFAGGASGMDDDELGSGDGEQSGKDAVPDIFADEDSYFAKSGFDKAELSAFFVESVFIENAIGGEEEFAVDVEEFGFSLIQREISGGVIGSAGSFFVEADGDIDGFWETWEARCEFVEELIGREREFIYAAFEDVSGWGGFGKDDKVGPFFDGLFDMFRQMVERCIEIALGWLGLETGHLERSGAI